MFLFPTDPLVQQLESGLVSAAERQQYSQDSRGQWVRRIGRGRTASYSKYCTTCNIWCVHVRVVIFFVESRRGP